MIQVCEDAVLHEIPESYVLERLNMYSTFNPLLNRFVFCWAFNGLQVLFVILQVDLKCITPAEGGYYYPDHLPVLGKLSTFIYSSFHPCCTTILSI